MQKRKAEAAPLKIAVKIKAARFILDVMVMINEVYPVLTDTHKPMALLLNSHEMRLSLGLIYAAGSP